MSIKQTGGVFGRNPTFNDVTIDGTLTFDGDIDINSDLKIDGDLEVNGKTTINNGSESIAIAAVNTAGNNNIVMANSVGSSKIMTNGANLWLYTDGNASSATASGATLGFQLDGSQNARLPYGNLIIGTSGKGIDFSATAGTGTSELLDDYEEGTWTPATFTNWSTAPTISNATYTKVGRQVTVRMQGLNGVASANGKIAGLPFTSGTSSTALFKDHSGLALYAFAGLPGSSTEINSMTAVDFTGAFWDMTCTYFV
jgi:hypothetical protein|tara:strand:- start:89 stop:856 length:768 start_codon:yes stop_codon:yes gene_type:complete